MGWGWGGEGARGGERVAAESKVALFCTALRQRDRLPAGETAERESERDNGCRGGGQRSPRKGERESRVGWKVGIEVRTVPHHRRCGTHTVYGQCFWQLRAAAAAAAAVAVKVAAALVVSGD